MDSYEITGGKRLSGEISLSGAKNAVLPILAATLLTGKESKILNCPDLSDVRAMTAILKHIGCSVKEENSCLTVDAGVLNNTAIPQELMREMRSSVFLMGPLIARMGKIQLTYPGGCEIGKRPIDIHIDALTKLGVEVKEKREEGILECTAKKLTGSTIAFDFPSVGATENAMMAACCALGETVIRNGAREPEIIDLQNFLNEAGAEIRGAGTDRIIIHGGQHFHDVEHPVISDRIEAGTYLAAAAITGGELFLSGAKPSFLSETLEKFRECGCRIKEGTDQIYLKAPEKLKAIKYIKTLPHPGFPTDMQSQMVALLSTAEGTSLVEETIFENRFKHVAQLKKMGADIVICENKAFITGVKRLQGAVVTAQDLRGGAALVLAALSAAGKTCVENICHIDRGYDKFDMVLRQLGADISRKSAVEE